MWQLIIRDWKAAKLYILALLIIIPISYAVNIYSSGIMTWALLSFLFIIFLVEKQNKVDLFLVSLPIRKKEIVRARYAFLLLLSILSIGLFWVVDYVGHFTLTYLETTRISLIEIIQLFWTTTLLFSIYIPVYYFFKEFIHAATFFMISFTCLIYLNVLTAGNPLITFDDPIRALIFELFTKQPYLMPILLSIICLCTSYLLSVKIFNRRDII